MLYWSLSLLICHHQTLGIFPIGKFMRIYDHTFFLRQGHVFISEKRKETRSMGLELEHEK